MHYISLSFLKCYKLHVSIAQLIQSLSLLLPEESDQGRSKQHKIYHIVYLLHCTPTLKISGNFSLAAGTLNFEWAIQ
jgi:hypothetical protein